MDRKRIKYQQTLKNLLDTTNMREPDKIPIVGNFYGWPFGYAGVKYSELKDDPQKAAQAYCECFDEIKFDLLFDAGVSQPVYAFEKLGVTSYTIGEDGNVITHNQANSEYFGPEVYDEIIKNPKYFMNETLTRFKVPAFKENKKEAYRALKECAIEMRKFLKINGLIKEYLEEKGVYFLMNSELSWREPFQEIFMRIRGIKDSLVDVRRRTNKVLEACKAMSDAEAWNYQPMDYCEPLPFSLLGYHPQCFLSPKYFDMFYFDDFKKTLLPFAEAGKKFLFLLEGDNTRTMSRYLDFPKGSLAFILDKEDPFEMHKLLGERFTLLTGMPADLMAVGTKQSCVDYVKRCYDTFAPGGGFIFCPNAPLMSVKEAKIENVIAVYETANALS